MAKFGDPTFRYHVAAAQAWGTVALRLGNAAALPMNYMDYAGEIRNFVTAIEQAATERRLADALDVKSLLSAVQELSEAAERLEARRSELILETERATRRGNSNPSAAAANLKRLNDGLIAAERALTDGRGLRGRSWYKHQIYAPGFYTFYAAQPLPDFRQAIDDRNPTAAHEAAVLITEALRRAAQGLSKGLN